MIFFISLMYIHSI